MYRAYHAPAACDAASCATRRYADQRVYIFVTMLASCYDHNPEFIIPASFDLPAAPSANDSSPITKPPHAMPDGSRSRFHVPRRERRWRADPPSER